MAVINDWRRETRGRIGLVDAVGASALFVLSVVAASVEPHEHGFLLRWPAPALAGLGCAALLVRRRHPFGVLAVAVACGAVFQLLGFRQSPLVTSPVLVSVYTVAVRTDRRTAWTAAWISASVLIGASAIGPSASWVDPDKVAMLAWTALPAAVGDGVRSRRAYVAAVEERAEHAERTREQEARQRVAAERVRIARELHDIVAHHIALINAQAGVAVHLVERRPEHLVTALQNIRDTSRAALDDLRVTVSLLRHPDDPVAPRGPVPGLAHVPDLLATFERAGLLVQQSRQGTARALEPAVDLAAYRIVQESLTNVRKHAGTGQARLTLRYAPDLLTILVEDDGVAAARPPAPGAGHGLIGMRERAATVGGSLDAGPRPSGGFAVRADLPLRPETSAEGTGASPEGRNAHDDPRPARR